MEIPLKTHEKEDEERFEKIEKRLSKAEMKHGDYKMKEHVNVFAGTPGMGGGFVGGHDGFGLGGGLVGGLVLGALLRNGGVGPFGGEAVGGCAASLATLSKLGDIQAQIPLTALQTQNAIASSTADITNGTLQQTINLGSQIATQTLGIQAGLGTVKDAIQNQNVGILASLAAVNQNVSNGTFAVTTAVRDDGDRTRALIQSIDSTNLNRQLTVAENALLEMRLNERRTADSHAITIQNTMNQNQNQLQFQQQAQAIGGLFNALHTCDQNIRATNQAINIGSGVQAANPTNTSANTKVN